MHLPRLARPTPCRVPLPRRPLQRRALATAALALPLLFAPSGAARAGRFTGVVEGVDGRPLAGAMVTVSHGDPIHSLTVFSDERGRFETPELAEPSPWIVRARKPAFRDLRLTDQALPATGERRLELRLERETDPAALVAELPANRWFSLVLARMQKPEQREELVRQCTYCHQQGSRQTRIHRDTGEWQKVLALMHRMGGTLDPELRAQVPALFEAAYDPKTAVPALVARLDEPGFLPDPAPEVRHAVIEEWEIGIPASLQHDVAVHPDGTVYVVDQLQDELYRLDPRVPGGKREAFPVPRGDLPLGGFTGGKMILPPNANSHVGPHSLQVAPDGTIWITLAFGNEIAGFDPKTRQWETHRLEEGLYPHTLRFDQKGRIWFSVAVSNHIGMLDRTTGKITTIRLPAASFGQELALRSLPLVFWLSRHFESFQPTSGEGIDLPVPYGVDVAPDGSVWFSQLNQHRIGRIDPETLAVEMIDTPFSGPRRLRFDSRGRLWIPGFSSSLIARFDPRTREFKSYPLPTVPSGSETPYALNVDRRTDTVWICGTASDSILRFDPASERFTTIPLPNRVTYTREIDFDAKGRLWTSNSNLPTWQVEGGYPRLIRIDPGLAAATTTAGGPMR
jgi:streptogramin lyase